MGWIVRARGHPMITAKHRTTFMVTKDDEVGPRGDCIIGVKANKSAAELFPAQKRLVKSGARLVIILRAKNFVERINAFGHPSLELDDPTDIVVRKSSYICGRTLAIEADKAAADFSREFVAAMQDPATVLEMKIVEGRGI